MALRCSGDVGWALQSALHALDLMAQQREARAAHQVAVANAGGGVDEAAGAAAAAAADDEADDAVDDHDLEDDDLAMDDFADQFEHDDDADEMNPQDVAAALAAVHANMPADAAQDVAADVAAALAAAQGAAAAGQAVAGAGPSPVGGTTVLSLEFACAVVYAERVHHAHNTLLLLSKDDPQSRPVHPIGGGVSDDHERLKALMSHFSAEACGLSESATAAGGAADGGAGGGGAADGGAAGGGAADGGAADAADPEGFAWQDREVLQDPAVRNSRCATWTRRHGHAVDRMNLHFGKACVVARLLSDRGGR